MKTTQRPKRAKVKPGHVIQVGDSVRVEVIGIKANIADVLIFAQDHITIAKRDGFGDTDSLTTQ